MLRNFEKASDLTADQRRGEIASLLAAGILRLWSRAALPPVGSTSPASEKAENSSPNCLEVPGETRLSGHGG
jgi:hypothetical protein